MQANWQAVRGSYMHYNKSVAFRPDMFRWNYNLILKKYSVVG